MNRLVPPGYGDVDRCVAQLRTWMADRVVTSAAVRDHHGRDTTFHPASPPTPSRSPQPSTRCSG